MAGERFALVQPPFSDLDAVLEKIKKDEATAILIAPDWRNQKYYSAMWEIAVNYYYYMARQSIFELDNVPAGPTKWGIWAVLLDGWKKSELAPAQTMRDTTSKKRRSRRRKLAAQWHEDCDRQ